MKNIQNYDEFVQEQINEKYGLKTLATLISSL